jgi:phosphoribosylformylglycinamidine synthase subunit PurQ / glutaminase
MKIAIVQFPGSNCDQDCLRAYQEGLKVDATYVWHKETSLDGFDAIVLPGGFSYGDYLRCGAIARFSPVMSAVLKAASDGIPILGICNGFQILCEVGLLPGALIRNHSLRFVCQETWLRVESVDTSITSTLRIGDLLRLPIAHGEGAYVADRETLKQLHEEGQIVFKYADPTGQTTPEANPNGSVENIAGICSAGRNVVGMMPHPDRAWDVLIGGTDGKVLLESMVQTLQAVA